MIRKLEGVFYSPFTEVRTPFPLGLNAPWFRAFSNRGGKRCVDPRLSVCPAPGSESEFVRVGLTPEIGSPDKTVRDEIRPSDVIGGEWATQVKT